jgi:hypothetical protein
VQKITDDIKIPLFFAILSCLLLITAVSFLQLQFFVEEITVYEEDPFDLFSCHTAAGIEYGGG